MKRDKDKVKEYGYQPTKVEIRGYQPTTSGSPTQSPPTPPSGGTSSQDK